MKSFFSMVKIAALFSLALSSFAFAEGGVTYTLHKSANPTADEEDAYRRITTVMDSAVKLYNTYSNLSKFINVYYSPGVPTAEASSNGDLRFGENRSYMVVPTAMHEMGHTMGIGTTQEYWDACQDGVFRNDKVQAKLRELSGKPSDELHCDRQHIWPYGLNQASEVKSEKDLIIHVQLVDFIHQQLFKEAFYKQGRIKSLGETKKCMGITSDNALELMDCSKEETFVKIFSVGDNPVTYYIKLGSRVVDIPNESTAPAVRVRRCRSQYAERVPAQEPQERALPAGSGYTGAAEPEGGSRRILHLAARGGRRCARHFQDSGHDEDNRHNQD